jgi:hypothetical protein
MKPERCAYLGYKPDNKCCKGGPARAFCRGLYSPFKEHPRHRPLWLQLMYRRSGNRSRNRQPGAPGSGT